MPDKPELKVTVFSDYICPFCYIGDARLNRLRDDYDLKVNWCFLEIHPETSAAGEPVTALDYSNEQWQRMMDTLSVMAAEEGLVLRDHDFTTNSRSALLLAEAAKQCGADCFYRLHAAIFEAFFVRGDNIGDRAVLTRLARQAGVPDDAVAAAWGEDDMEQRLRAYALAAHQLEVRATPTFFIGERRLDGAVPVDRLLDAARVALA